MSEPRCARDSLRPPKRPECAEPGCVPPTADRGIQKRCNGCARPLCLGHARSCRKCEDDPAIRDRPKFTHVYCWRCFGSRLCDGCGETFCFAHTDLHPCALCEVQRCGDCSKRATCCSCFERFCDKHARSMIRCEICEDLSCTECAPEAACEKCHRDCCGGCLRSLLCVGCLRVLAIRAER